MKLRSYDDFDLQQIEARLSGVRMERTPEDLSVQESTDHAWAHRAQFTCWSPEWAEQQKEAWLRGRASLSFTKRGRLHVPSFVKERIEEMIAGAIIHREDLSNAEDKECLSCEGGSAWYCDECHGISFPNRPCRC